MVIQDFEDVLEQVDECQSRIEQLRPLSESEVAQLKAHYKVGLTYSSNALEGNSLTETETKVVLEDGITVGGKPVKDHLEALGHAQAFDHLSTLAQSKTVSEQDILHLHQLFYRQVDSDNAGKYRSVRMVLSGSDTKLPAPQEVPELMQMLVSRLPELKQNYHPVECAALVHYELAYIHPFVDGNGRTARLVMNLLLLQHRFPITIIPPVTRVHYLDALRQADQGNPKPFIQFIGNMVWEAQKEYLRLFS